MEVFSFYKRSVGVSKIYLQLGIIFFQNNFKLFVCFAMTRQIIWQVLPNHDISLLQNVFLPILRASVSSVSFLLSEIIFSDPLNSSLEASGFEGSKFLRKW